MSCNLWFFLIYLNWFGWWTFFEIFLPYRMSRIYVIAIKINKYFFHAFSDFVWVMRKHLTSLCLCGRKCGGTKKDEMILMRIAIRTFLAKFLQQFISTWEIKHFLLFFDKRWKSGILSGFSWIVNLIIEMGFCTMVWSEKVKLKFTF